MLDNDAVIAAIEKNTATTKQLTERVETLAERSGVSEVITRRTRIQTFWIAGLVGAFFLLSCVFGWYMWRKAEENHANAYTQCVNNNESRKFQIDMWDYILGHELGDTSKAQAPDEIVMSEEILPKIHYGYRPRDCDHLEKKYDMPEIPNPPGGKVRIIGGKAILDPEG